MRTSDLHTGAATLRDAMKDLQIAWQEAHEHWNDGVSRAFEHNHLEPMVPVVKLTLDSMQRMLHLAEEMRRACGEQNDY